jgi:hypothetical protein
VNLAAQHQQYGVAESVKNKMIPWAYLAKSPPIKIDVYPANLPITELVNVAIQITRIGLQEHEVSKIELNPVIKNKDDVSACKRCIHLVIHYTVQVVLSMVVGGLIVQSFQNEDPNKISDDCNSLVIGDGVCDDKENIPECNYDGQDCCLHTMNTLLCEVCKCLHICKCRIFIAPQSLSLSF